MRLVQTVKCYEQGQPIRLIETDTQTLPIDIFDGRGVPADLSGATAFFHLMEFSTQANIWSRPCQIVFDAAGGVPNVRYPYTVLVGLTNSDTENLQGHYTGQLELIDHNGLSRFPFQIEIIVAKNAS